MHEVRLSSNKIVILLYIFKGFLSLSILVLLEDSSWNKKAAESVNVVEDDICLTFEKTEHF